MKTIEELEAELETVTRERDLSLAAWESAGMTGRTAQSAMLELARWLVLDAHAEIAILTTALDERDLEAERGIEQYDRLAHQLADAKREIEALTDERDELLVRVAEQGAELRATREAYNQARAEVAQDIHLACLDARRDEREMIASWLSAEIHRLPVYQPSYGPKELRARSRALEGAACAVRSCAHVPRVEDDDA